MMLSLLDDRHLMGPCADVAAVGYARSKKQEAKARWKQIDDVEGASKLF